MRKRIWGLWVALLVPSAAAAQSLVLAGSGSNLAITRLLGQAFGAESRRIRIEVPESIGSTGGIRAAADGAVALGLVSRSLRDDEKGLGLSVVPYARTPLVLGVHPTVPEDGITRGELVAIYKGGKRRWRAGLDIVVLTREPGDSAIEMMEGALPGFRQAYADSYAARRWTVLYTDQDADSALARTAGAIGLTTLGNLIAGGLPIKPLRLDGVAPTLENTARGRYPLVKTLAFVYREDRLTAAARAFIDFVRSKRVERVLRANGYLPAQSP